MHHKTTRIDAKRITATNPITIGFVAFYYFLTVKDVIITAEGIMGN